MSLFLIATGITTFISGAASSVAGSLIAEELNKFLEKKTVSNAIDSTEKTFPDIALREHLTKWCVTADFGELNKSLLDGNFDGVYKDIVKSFVNTTDFYYPDTVERFDKANDILTHFFKELTNELLRTPDGLILIANSNIRLHEETRIVIIEAVQSLLASNPQKILELTREIEKKPRFHSLHNQLAPDPNFVGRKRELGEIDGWYKDPAVKIGALVAWGGQGKSTIARQFYDEMGKRGISPQYVFWWNFYIDPSFDAFLNALLIYLLGHDDLSQFKDLRDKVDKLKRLLQDGEHLIVLDGLETMQKSEGASHGTMAQREYTDLLAGMADSKFNGLCLITTRYQMTDLKNYKTFNKMDIDRLSPEDGRQLFRTAGVKGDDTEIDEVAMEFEGHAQSLALIANSLVEDFHGDIREAKKIPPVYSGEEAGGKAYRTLKWYDGQLNEKQKAFLKLFSLFREETGEKAFAGVFRKKLDTPFNETLVGMEEFFFNRMVSNLCDRKLISRKKKGEEFFYTAHPNVKGYFAHAFESEAREAKKLCHKALYEYYIGHELSEKPSYDELRPLIEAVHHALEVGMIWAACGPAVDLGNVLEGLVLYREKAARLQAVADRIDEAVIKEAVVEKDEYVPMLLNNLGSAWQALGEPKKAIEYHKKALAIFESVFGKEHQNVATSLNNLGSAWQELGENKKAIEYYKKALEIDLKVFGDVHPSTARDYNNLGAAWQALGDNKKAIEYLEKALEIDLRVSGDEHPDTAIGYNNFGIAWKDLGENKKAIEYLEKALTIIGEVYGEVHPHYASTLNNLGGAWQALGDNKKAIDYYEKALEIDLKVFGDGHPHTIQVKKNLKSLKGG